MAARFVSGIIGLESGGTNSILTECQANLELIAFANDFLLLLVAEPVIQLQSRCNSLIDKFEATWKLYGLKLQTRR